MQSIILFAMTSAFGMRLSIKNTGSPAMTIPVSMSASIPIMTDIISICIATSAFVSPRKMFVNMPSVPFVTPSTRPPRKLSWMLTCCCCWPKPVPLVMLLVMLLPPIGVLITLVPLPMNWFTGVVGSTIPSPSFISAISVFLSICPNT